MGGVQFGWADNPELLDVAIAGVQYDTCAKLENEQTQVSNRTK